MQRARSTEGELPEDVREFLLAFAKALQRLGLYPAGHRAAEPMIGRVHEALEQALSARERLEIEVSPETLSLEDAETDPGAPTLGKLARHLHDHGLSGLTFRATPDRDQVVEMLTLLAEAPDEGEEPARDRARPDASWPDISLVRASYDHLRLDERAGGPAGEGSGRQRARRLWRDLARAARAESAAGDGEGEDEELPRADRVAGALDRLSRDGEEAGEATARMVGVVRELGRSGPGAAPEVRREMTELLERLDREALDRLFGAGGPDRRAAMLDAGADWMDVETVLDLVRGMVEEQDLDVPGHILRVLSKLADYAEEGGEGGRAEQEFREEVRDLLSGWRDNIEAPGARDRGRGILDRRRSTRAASRRMVESRRIVMSTLELGRIGRVGGEAVEEMVEQGDIRELIRFLQAPPEPDADLTFYWERLSRVKVLRDLLSESPPAFDAVDRLVERMGSAAADPLLDALALADARSVRMELFSRLVELPEDAADAIRSRLGDDRWYVQRNMLALLAERGDDPEGFSPLEYADHERAEVRREAFRLALRRPDEREEAVRRGLRDPDARVAGMAMGALAELDDGALAPLLPELVERTGDESIPGHRRRPAVRALGRIDREEATEALLDLCRRRRLFGLLPPRLAEKSPLMLEALSTLASHRPDHPGARKALGQAREADDPEVRAAARGEREEAR